MKSEQEVMRHCRIQCTFEGIGDLCKVGNEYLSALACTLAFHSRENSETFDILHAFLSSAVAKLSALKNSAFVGPPCVGIVNVRLAMQL